MKTHYKDQEIEGRLAGLVTYSAAVANDFLSLGSTSTGCGLTDPLIQNTF